MTTETIISECKKLIAEPGIEIMFDSVMQVKKSPHQIICRCYGVVLTEDNELKLLTSDGEWYEYCRIRYMQNM